MFARALSAILPDRRASTDFGPLSDFWYNPVGSTSSAGIVVKPDNSMQVAAVFSCIRFLSEMIGCLDFEVFKREAGRDVVDEKHYLWDTVRNRPNSWQTPMEWGEMGMAHLCLRGNFYNQIVSGPDGIELWPLVPDRMKPQQVANKRITYVYQEKVGETRSFTAGEILHIRGLSTDGVIGVSVLEFARNAVGSAIAQETHGSALFKNGGLPTFWIGRPQGNKFTQEARRNFRLGWRKIHGGAENAGNPPILEDGMELHELGLTNRDSQWIEAREFQATDICRFFRVNPQIIYAGKGSVDLDQLSNETKRYTLYPWVRRWCQAMERDLLDRDDKNHFIHMSMDDLEIVSMLSRYQSNNIAIQGGWKLPNEARSDEGWEPIDGGDMARFPLNMQPAGGGPDEQQQGGQPGKGTPKPPQQKQPDPEPADDDTAYQKRKKKDAKAAFSVLIDEAAARIAATEIKGLGQRADKAEQDREKWAKWCLSFYAKHHIYAAKTLDPICAAWLAATNEEHEPGDLAAKYCSSIGESLDYGTDIPTVLENWKTTRGPWLAEQLKKELFDEKV